MLQKTVIADESNDIDSKRLRKENMKGPIVDVAIRQTIKNNSKTKA